MTHFLEVKSVVSGYGSMEIIHGLSLHVNYGENVGLFGPNGHGKTTLLRSVSGLLQPKSGSLYFDSEEITKMSPSDIVGRGLVQAQQGNTLFGDMQVSETLNMVGHLTRRSGKKVKENLDYVYSLFPRLTERRLSQSKTLSGGERQMLSIGVALMCVPRLLILDEPTLGLSPKLKKELSHTLKEISKSLPLVIVEQDVELLLSVTDRLYMIEHGEVVKEINKENAPDHNEIMSLYFGES